MPSPYAVQITMAAVALAILVPGCSENVSDTASQATDSEAEEAPGATEPEAAASLQEGFEARKDYYFGIDFPHARLDPKDLKRSLPYALITLQNTGGKDKEAAEFISNALDPALAVSWKGRPPKVDIFVITDVVRALIAFPDAFTDEQIARIEGFARQISDFAGGGTENHRMMRWSSGYYFAQRFGGEWRIDDRTVPAEELLAVLTDKFMEEFRFRMDNGGMSEFLSPNYLVHHVYPIMNLIETCEDPGLREAAQAVVMLHLSHLALNVHDGYILEPHSRSGGTQFTGRNVRRPNGSQYLSWILWGTFDPGPARLTHPGDQVAVVGPFLCDWQLDPFLHDLANGNGVTPFASRSVGMNWPHASEKRMPRTTLRSIYRSPRYAVGAGYQQHVPEGFYLQHSLFGITWTSGNEAAFLQCGHNYWFADNGQAAMWKAPNSPFQQMAHHENSTLMVFNIPDRDPWPGAGRSDWTVHREGHASNLIDHAMVRLPREVKNRVWETTPDGGNILFLNDDGVYLAIRSLTPAKQVRIDDDFDGIRSIPRRNGSRSQSAFFFHVGTDEDYASFELFQEKVLAAEIVADWGEGPSPAPRIRVTDPDGDILSLTYNNTVTPEENGVVPNLPEVVINGEPLDFKNWPDMEGPGVKLENGILTVNEIHYQIPDPTEE
jgi:hypothetical protein